MTQPVFNQRIALENATFRGMGARKRKKRRGSPIPSALWKKWAVKLHAHKRLLGRGIPERALAEAVESMTGHPSGRQLLGMWLQGRREPSASQFICLCLVMNYEIGRLVYDAIPLAEANKNVRLRTDESTVDEQITTMLKKSRKAN